MKQLIRNTFVEMRENISMIGILLVSLAVVGLISGATILEIAALVIGIAIGALAGVATRAVFDLRREKKKRSDA